MTPSGEMQFSIEYDAAIMRGAVNTFMKRRLLGGVGRLGIAAVIVTGAALASLLWQGDRSWVVGAIGSVLLLFALIFFALWQWRHAEMRSKLDAIPSRQGLVTLAQDEITIKTEAGSTSLPWTTFTEIWKLEHSWLLFLAQNNFVTLPIDGVPADALEYIEARLPRTCIIG